MAIADAPRIKVRRVLKGTRADIETQINDTVTLLETSIPNAKVATVTPGTYDVTHTTFGAKIEAGKREWVAVFKVTITFEMTKGVTK